MTDYGWGIYGGIRPVIYFGVIVNGWVMGWQQKHGFRVWPNIWRKNREPIQRFKWL